MSPNIQTEIKCYMCNSNNNNNNMLFSNLKEECDSNCFISSFSNDWITVLHKNFNKYLKMKLVIKQKLFDKELTKSLVYVNLNQAKHIEIPNQLNNNPTSTNNINAKKSIQCELNQNNNNNDLNLNTNNKLCLNMSINLNSEFSEKSKCSPSLTSNCSTCLI